MPILFEKKKRANPNLVVMLDWNRFHSDTSPTDAYYVRLCNTVLKIILRSELKTDCGSAERTIRLACILTAYFEDVISETHIFHTFTQQHRELYGRYLPFFDTTEDYDPDELNLCDLHFLAWHALSLWQKEDDGIMVDPFFRGRNSPVAALNEIYGLFDREYERAPQNETMQDCLLHLPHRADVGEIRKRLEFFSDKSYLNIIEYDGFTNRTLAEMEEVSTDEDEDEDINDIIGRQSLYFYDSCMDYIFNHYASLLARRTVNELSALIGREHPMYSLIEGISTRKFGCYRFVREKSEEMIFEHIPSGTEVNVSKEHLNIRDNHFTNRHSYVIMSIVKWGDAWQQTGMAIVSASENKPGEDWPGASAFDDPEEKKRLIKKMETAFLKVNHGNHIAYLNSLEELYDLYDHFIDATLPKVALMSKKNKHSLPDGLRKFAERVKGILTLFFNPACGIEMYGSVTTAIADPGNACFVAGETLPLEDVLIDESYSKEFIHYLLDNGLVAFTAGESGTKTSVILDNLDFLFRYYRPENYRT
ncbi:MAG: DUF3843 family protein [Tannerella sp.]|jgi:hypothetical protein|nr:DUF3843 family protein [Tannerella sp.]